MIWSPKGRKDFLDLLAMVVAKKCNLTEVIKIVNKYHLQLELETLKTFLDEEEKIPELNLNPHFYSKLKKIDLNLTGV